MQDYDTIQLDEWTELEKEELFKLNEQKILPYERKDNTWLSITLEMDLNRIDYSRSRYTLFDLLSDVGGLSGMFASIFAFFMAVWNFNALDDFIVAKLYRMKSKKTDNS